MEVTGDAAEAKRVGVFAAGEPHGECTGGGAARGDERWRCDEEIDGSEGAICAQSVGDSRLI